MTTPKRVVDMSPEAIQARLKKLMESPYMQPEAIRARMEASAKWEEEHGEVTVFCGKLYESPHQEATPE